MSTTTNRNLAPREGGSVDDRLARVIPHLAPETLHQLIRYRGLDACGDVLTSATPAQLNALLDLDLWRHAEPGRDAQFDVDRFGEWLEVLVDAGDSVAARIVADLDTHLVIAGLSRYLRAFDPGTFEPTESSDDEPTDRHQMMSSETSADVAECEVGGYLVRARRTDAWDAILTLLVTLEIEHNDYFHAVMQGCRRLSNSRAEIDGLDDLLVAPEQHLHDVSIEREQRRSRLGYATPADARAFLEMARQPQRTINPIATAYFRAVDEAEDRDADRLRQGYGGQAVTPEGPRALLDGATGEPPVVKLPLLRRLMESLLHHDETAYLARTRELAFLANTLLAGSSVQSRPFTTQEAADAAASICNLGLECGGVEHDLVSVFEVGWSVLYRDVSLSATDQLIATLGDVRCDAGTRRELRAFRRELVKQREAGTPWLARNAADVLAMLDTTAWVSVQGLLNECPILNATLTAVLERRATSVSPTAFEFFSTTAQIGDVRLFMRALPSLLSS